MEKWTIPFRSLLPMHWFIYMTPRHVNGSLKVPEVRSKDGILSRDKVKILKDWKFYLCKKGLCINLHSPSILPQTNHPFQSLEQTDSIVDCFLVRQYINTKIFTISLYSGKFLYWNVNKFYTVVTFSISTRKRKVIGIK